MFLSKSHAAPTDDHRTAPPTFGPPTSGAGTVVGDLSRDGYAIVDAAGLSSLTGASIAALSGFEDTWADLPPDAYLKDGGRYRQRRHACFVLDADGGLVRAPHRAHWQPVEYNALHGGMQRWFEPIAATVADDAAWSALVTGLGRVFGQVRDPVRDPVDEARRPARRWFVEAHQFRIDTTDGIGRPTPEGAHRDGVDFVAVVLVARHGVKGGETRVFEANGPHGQRFTMVAPWTALLLDDARVIHETTPVQPVSDDASGTRDTLVLTYRAAGFQGDDA